MPNLPGQAARRIIAGVWCTLSAAVGICWQAPPQPPSTPAASPETVTFAKDIAPILFTRCAGCHHPGESAPFSLMSFEDARKRAQQIVDVTHRRFMPPWMPADGKGDFVGARRLSDRELDLLKKWVDQGTAAGNPADAPAPPVFAEGWQLGTPDLILETPAYTLSSQDRDVFRNFVVPMKLESPRWIESIELRPDNPRVTHHARLGVDSSRESIRRDAEDKEPGYAGMAWGQDPDGQLVIWAPGMVATPGTPGVAWRLYPDACLVLHTHMQPSGKPEVVKFRIGIHFAKTAPTSHPVMMRIGTCNIDIPAGAAHHVVSDEYTLPIDIDVQSVFPHAHSLCTQLQVTAVRPDGTTQPLIDIPHFDENWHDSYRYVKPVRLPKGTRLVSTFAYNNTDANIRNRNHPARRVVYGSNATDEMADVYLLVAAVRPDQREVLMEHYKRYEMRAQVVGNGKALEMFPENTWNIEALASAYVGLGEPVKAVSLLEKRLTIGPKEVFPVTSYGMTLLAGGDAAKAEAQLRQATTMDPEYPLAWLGLGKALAVAKQSEPAERAFRRAVELAPGMLDARLSLADLLVKRGQLAEAATVCANALSDSPDMANIYVKLAEISAKQQKYDESLAYCVKARAIAPYTHPAKVLLAVFAVGNGDQERGLRLLREAREEEPGNPMAALTIAQLARRQQQTAIARENLAFAMSIPMPDNWPESHQRRYQVLLHSERLQLAQQIQDLGMARDALTQWMQVDPENAQLKKMLDSLPAAGAP